ncbi:MAG: hypoxanthine phosphoribosyltransferase [candidate division Zixibacteria bacterium RBG_16_53_22]|nr:MAG: hypoxanthine phosphoribosyltransferase [candidate division Zixibacteria bacterium RBG_16_53_22]
MRALITEKRLQARIRALGRAIARDYKDKTPIFIGILKGSFIFMADLIREVDMECEVDFMGVASYGSSKRGSGVVRLLKDINVNVQGRHILIVEDIIDSGLTVNYIKQYLQLRKPKSIEFVTLLDKKKARKIDIDIKYVGFDIPEVFVVGYGLDFDEKYRQLPFIAKG